MALALMRSDGVGGRMTEGCPDGMGAVITGDTVLYCVDAYEVIVEGDMGDKDQLDPHAKPPTAVALSVKGVIPSTGVSFDQAVAICANTPVIDPAGGQHGFKQLVTVAEWRDAADGVPGRGGTRFPFGDEFDPTICATPDGSGAPIYQELQLTGSLPECVSAFGLYDQCGNAFEWADSGMSTDARGWFELTNSAGYSMGVDADGALTISAGWDPDLFQLRMAAIPIHEDLVVDEEGRLTVRFDPAQYVMRGEIPSGFLVFGDRPEGASGGAYLPITLLTKSPPMEADTVPLKPILDPPALPIPAKVGGAYYSGFPEDSCSTNAASFGHAHDFDGTIGFRCACAPVRFLE